MCKRIIDYCRSKYIEEKVNEVLARKEGNDLHFHSQLVYYCNAEDSPENCIILGSLYSLVCSFFLFGFAMELQSCLWSQDIEKSRIPEECLVEDVIVGIDEAGRGPVMGIHI